MKTKIRFVSNKSEMQAVIKSITFFARMIGECIKNSGILFVYDKKEVNQKVINKLSERIFLDIVVKLARWSLGRYSEMHDKKKYVWVLKDSEAIVLYMAINKFLNLLEPYEITVMLRIRDQIHKDMIIND